MTKKEFVAAIHDVEDQHKDCYTWQGCSFVEDLLEVIHKYAGMNEKTRTK